MGTANECKPRAIRMRIEAFTVDNVPRVKGGDDITDFLQDADLRDGDVVVIASTIISKAEGFDGEFGNFLPQWAGLWNR